MSVLSQLVPLSPDRTTSIDLATSVWPVPAPGPVGVALDRPTDDDARIVGAEGVVRILLGDGEADDVAIPRLEADVDEYVDVWTPTLHTTTRFELIAALAEIDDVISDVVLTITETVATPSGALMTWQATGRFARPAFFDDDHLLEPNGAVVHVAGATSVSFTAAGRAERIRCYYDRLGLIEQLLAPSPPAE